MTDDTFTGFRGAPPQPPRKKRRVFLWVYLAVNALFLVWVIAGISSTAGTHHCKGLNTTDCTNAAQTGGAIGIALVVFFWLAVAVIMLAVYGVWRFTRRGRDNLT